MERYESPVDMKLLGSEMRKLRHEKGMSVVRFANELGKPVWLIDVIEHADDEMSFSLCSMLPKQEIASVQEAFEKLRSTARFWDVDVRGRKAASSTEQTFYLPVTISDDSLMDVMDQLLLFVSDAAENDAKRQYALRQGVVSVELMLWLLQTQYRRVGNEKKARQCLHGFQENLQSRMRVS